MLDKTLKVLHRDTHVRVTVDSSYIRIIVLKDGLGFLHGKPKHG